MSRRSWRLVLKAGGVVLALLLIAGLTAPYISAARYGERKLRHWPGTRDDECAGLGCLVIHTWRARPSLVFAPRLRQPGPTAWRASKNKAP